MTQVNGLEITPELADYLRANKESFAGLSNVMSDVIDFLIDVMSGQVPNDPSEQLKKLMFDVKWVKDETKSLDALLSNCKTE